MESKKLFNADTLKQMDGKAYGQMALLGFILLYAFTRFISPGAFKIAEGGLVLCLLYFLVKNSDQIRRDPMFLLFMGVIIAQLATWVSLELLYPELPGNKLKIDRMGKLFFFIPIAWGLKNRQKWVPIVLLIACAGFIADLFAGSDFFAEFSLALKGARVAFGVRNEQHTSMVFGLFVIIGTFYTVVADKKVKAGGAFFILLIGLAGLTATQTRQTFLGVILAVIVVFTVSCFVTRFSLKKIIISVVIIGVFVGMAGYSIKHDKIKGVWETFKVFTGPLPEHLKNARETEVLAYYISKQNKSTGTRLKLWLSVVPYMAQHPLLGWGSSSITPMIEDNPLLKGANIGKIKHLHNYHLTVYICYGIIGLLLINGVYVWLLISSFRIRKRCVNGNEWVLLSAGFVTYWMVINCFENFNGFWTGVFCHNLILGCIYSHYLANKEHP